MKNFLLITLIALLSFVAFSSAGTIMWSGGMNGDWNNAANWVGGVVPTTTDDVSIAGGVFVSLGQTTTINSLTLSGSATLTVSNVPGDITLGISTNLTITGTATLRVDTSETVTVFQFLRFMNGGTFNVLISGTAQSAGLFVSGGTPTINAEPGNNFAVLGTIPHTITSTFRFPSTGLVLGSAPQTFNGGATLEFNYAPTIAATWTLDNNPGPFTVRFDRGVTFNTGASFAVTNTSRPITTSFLYGGTVNTNLALSIIGGSHTISQPDGLSNVFAGTSTLSLQGPLTINTPAIGGTSTVNSLNTNNNEQVAIGQNLMLNNPNFVFGGSKTFSGNQVTFTNAVSIQQSFIVSNNFIFEQNAVLATGANFTGTGTLTFTASFTSSSSNPILNPVVFKCPQGTFSVAGAATNTIRGGLTVEGCVVTSAPQITVENTLVTKDGNSTMPTQFTFIGNPLFQFSSSGTPPTGSIFSIRVAQNQFSGTTTIWRAVNIELFPGGTGFTLLDNHSLQSTVNGLVSINGGTISLRDSSTIGGVLGLNGTVAFAAQSPGHRFPTDLLLYNGASISASSSDFRFTGSISVFEGSATISNTNFVFDANLGVSLRPSSSQNARATLIIAGDRIFDTQVTANMNTFVRFTGAITFNTTNSFTATAMNSAIEFSAATLSSIAQWTLNGNITFLSAVRLIGSGNFVISGSNLNVFGNINSPQMVGDTTATITSTNVNLFADVSFGSVITYQGGTLNDDDDDNNNVRRTLTLDAPASGTTPRNIGGFTLNANLIVNGNVRLTGATYSNNVNAFMRLTGTSIVLAGSVTFTVPLELTNAVTITSETSATRTLTLRQNPTVFNVPGTITVVKPAQLTFTNQINVVFAANSGINGDATVTLGNAIVTANGPLNIIGETISTTGTTFLGSAVTLTPSDANLMYNGVSGGAPVTYAGSKVTFTANSEVPSTVSFTATNVTFEGQQATFTGPVTIANNWKIDNNVIFKETVTLSGEITGTGTVTFETALLNTAAKTINNNVVFGVAGMTSATVAVSQTGMLQLGSNTVTVNSIVVNAGGTIRSTKSGQTIAGGGVIPMQWDWNVPLTFGKLNITGQRTISRVHTLSATGNDFTIFTGGLIIAAGAGFIPAGANANLGVEVGFTTNVVYELPPSINLQVSGLNFNFDGTAVLTTNGTFTCRSAITFTTQVIFGWTSPSTGNTINLAPGCQWMGTTTLQLWRTTVAAMTNSNTAIQNPIIFGLGGTVTVNINGPGTAIFNGDITLLSRNFNLNANSLSLGSITFTASQNGTLGDLRSAGVVTFANAANVYPIVSFAGSLQSSIVLNGPIRFVGQTLGNDASVSGSASLYLVDSVTVSGSNVILTGPTRVITNVGNTDFTFTANTNTELTLTNPSFMNNLFNLPAPNVIKNGAGTVTIAGGSHTIADLTINNNGVFRVSQGVTFGAVNIQVNNNATLWDDGATMTATNIQFTENADLTVASNFQYTVTTNANPPRLTVSGNAIYRGVIVVSANFNWDGNEVPAISAASSSSTEFSVTRGAPGFTYTSTKINNDILVSRASIPTSPPAPTQSSGPTPAVSSASFIQISTFALLLISFVFFFILA